MGHPWRLDKAVGIFISSFYTCTLLPCSRPLFFLYICSIIAITMPSPFEVPSRTNCLVASRPSWYIDAANKRATARASKMDIQPDIQRDRKGRKKNGEEIADAEMAIFDAAGVVFGAGFCCCDATFLLSSTHCCMEYVRTLIHIEHVQNAGHHDPCANTYKVCVCMYHFEFI